MKKCNVHNVHCNTTLGIVVPSQLFPFLLLSWRKCQPWILPPVNVTPVGSQSHLPTSPPSFFSPSGVTVGKFTAPPHCRPCNYIVSSHLSHIPSILAGWRCGCRIILISPLLSPVLYHHPLPPYPPPFSFRALYHLSPPVSGYRVG